MKFAIIQGDAKKQANDCLIVGVFEANGLTSAATKIDKELKGHISKLLQQGDIDGKIGQSLLLPLADRKILLVKHLTPVIIAKSFLLAFVHLFPRRLSMPF